MATHYISNEVLDFNSIAKILNENMTLALSENAKAKIIKCRTYLDNKMETHNAPIYGINTGFGSLYNISIGKEDLTALQENLMMSHACGVGEEVPNIIVKIMLLLKAQSLSYGHSGVQLITVERLISMFNNNVLPVVYQGGSLGASGDLSPLAHLSLPLIGMGEVNYKGNKVQTKDIMADLNWEPITMQSKEGLALLNGTQFMSSYGVYISMKAEKVSILADLIGSLSLDAYDGRIEPFTDAVHQIRHHKGQIDTATRIRSLLKGSELIVQYKEHV
ncbi:MAG: aromatic amino acid lyase, partial [Bacteroidales bacterium]|nr:aromatic amino acid lyase [Bacteroidales bacterium]